MKGLKTIVLAVIATIAIFSIAFTKLQNKDQETRDFALTSTNSTKKLKEKIFAEKEILTSEINELVNFKDLNNNTYVTETIDESKLEKVLSPYIMGKIKKLGEKNGWNIEEIEGKIYYKIKNLKIEIYVEWKTSIYEDTYTHYDWFEIVFQ